MLNLKIYEKKVEIISDETFVHGTVGAKCKITFDNFWEKFNKVVVFKCVSAFGKPYEKYADSMTVELTIPWEVLKNPGKFRIGVYGTTDELTLPTLWSNDISVMRGTDTTGTAAQAPSANIANQMISVANEAISIAQSVRDDADAGVFNGKDGSNYILTEADKQEIAGIINAAIIDANGVKY